MHEGPMVTFLFGAMKDAGCPMASNGIECVKCEDNQEGARFDTSSKVILILLKILLIDLENTNMPKLDPILDTS